ncbi:MAG: hypothetical protein KBD90_03320 [Alphaproteobacteria bacterium]|nr:hypothetical protein [Alphaproteobacteria bacterium]
MQKELLRSLFITATLGAFFNTIGYAETEITSEKSLRSTVENRNQIEQSNNEKNRLQESTVEHRNKIEPFNNEQNRSQESTEDRRNQVRMEGKETPYGVRNATWFTINGWDTKGKWLGSIGGWSPHYLAVPDAASFPVTLGFYCDDSKQQSGCTVTFERDKPGDYTVWGGPGHYWTTYLP